MHHRQIRNVGRIGWSLPILLAGLACNFALPGAEPTATPGGPPLSDCGEGEAAEVAWPSLESVEPAQAEPGIEINVVGSGGYEQCGDSFNESARDFQLYWNGEPIAKIGCYVNHCEATLAVPDDAATGVHVLSVDGGSALDVEVRSQP